MQKPPDFRSEKRRSFFRFDNSVNWGSIGCTVTVLVGIIIAYDSIKNDSANDHAQIVEMKQSNKAQVDELKSSISILTSTLVETNLAVRELKTVVQIEGTRTRLENRENK